MIWRGKKQTHLKCSNSVLQFLELYFFYFYLFFNPVRLCMVNFFWKLFLLSCLGTVLRFIDGLMLQWLKQMENIPLLSGGSLVWPNMVQFRFFSPTNAIVCSLQDLLFSCIIYQLSMWGKLLFWSILKRHCFPHSAGVIIYSQDSVCVSVCY